MSSRNAPATGPIRPPMRSSQLRQFSRAGLDRPAGDMPQSPDTVSSNTSTIRDCTPSVRSRVERRFTVTINESLLRDEVILNLDLIGDEVKAGTLVAIEVVKPELEKQSQASLNKPGRDGGPPRAGGPARAAEGESHYICVAKDMPGELKMRLPNVEVYVAKHVADAFGMKRGSQVILKPIDVDNPAVEASHVELSFKDQYLSRADMWRLARGDLSHRTVYKGQLIFFMGTIKAQVTTVYVDGRKVKSAFFGQNTKPIFRSESARYVLFIQMAREMWDFDSDGSGELIFNKVVNGFLPALFKKWAAHKVKHLVTIVLFSRVEYDTGILTDLSGTAAHNDYYTGTQSSGERRPYKDFYRVVVSEMASGEWTTILYQLKREFNYFRKDISTYHLKAMAPLSPTTEDAGDGANALNRIKAEASKAMYGNFLEAINMASSLFSHDYIDRDLMRTGISVAVISASPGIFEVDYELLRKTTESLVGNGIGIDLICVPKIPLHSVPLFRYRKPPDPLQNKGKPTLSLGTTPKQSSSGFGSYSSLSTSFSPGKWASLANRSDFMGSKSGADEWAFALPQWLHVSYWNGSSGGALLYQGIALSVPGDLVQDGDEFPIRCRMYDLQMRSVMETNEIETKPLHLDPHFPLKAIQASRISNPLAGPDGTLFIQNTRVPETLFDHVYGFQKFAPDRNSVPSEKSIWKQLQEYDDARARPEPTRAVSRSGRNYDDTSRRQAAQDANLLGTSYSSRRPSIMGRASGLSSEYHPNPNRLQIPQTRAALVDESHASKATPTRPPKFGRQISLGRRGFGIAAPKAVTAEVSVETVGASKTPVPARMTPAGPPQRPGSPQHPMVGTPTSSHGRLSPHTFGRGPHSPLETPTPSRPISIRSQQPSMDSSATLTPGSTLSATLRPDHIHRDLEARHSDAIRAQDSKKVKLHNSKLLAGPDPSPTLSPKTAMSPWLTELNPSNPDYKKIDMTMLYSRWQHVFPRPSDMQIQKWKSLCSPAAVPLTTEYFPTQEELDELYECQPYNVGQDFDDDFSEEPKSRDELLREMTSLRLSQGFQIVIPEAVAKSYGQDPVPFKLVDVFSSRSALEDNSSVFMSVGNTIHQLTCANGSEIEVNIFVRKPMDKTPQSDDGPTSYKPAVRTLFDKAYETGQFRLFAQKPERNWSFIDSFVAGHNDEMTEHLRFWRGRFVLIPVNARLPSSQRASGDNDEEVRIEGIRRLAQIWQKNRYVPPAERRYQSINSRRRKVMNPLDIIYKTEDPSVVIAAELETLPLLEGLEGVNRKGQLVRSREQFQKKNFSLAALAEAIQQPVENGGVRMQNRRWHLRLHYNCFIGSDMTSWLLENFEDLEDREEAEALGNRLMVSDDDKHKDRDQRRETGGLFVHVERRHLFRDGQYFYQISSDFAKPPPPSWFNSRRNHPAPSAPSTPLTENMPRDGSRTNLAGSLSIHDDDSTNSGTTTPTAPQPPPGVKRPKVVLSKSIKYHVDPRKRSYRPEIVELHYDRLHNPDNCYHIRIDWMNVTAKLIEDAIESWAGVAQQYSLRLVEVPIAEACAITDINPFRRPYLIRLALPPPDHQPRTYFDPTSFTPSPQPGRHYYQKALLRKFDFVLDVEAASNFPANVDVSYSWGRPDFRYTQYIHRTGVVLAQITDDGALLLLANRLYSNRAAAARERELRAPAARSGGPGVYTPYGIDSPGGGPGGGSLLSPVVRPALSQLPTPSPIAANAYPLGTAPKGGPTTPSSSFPPPPAPEVIKSELEAFCADPHALDAFYRELQLQAAETKPPTASSSSSGGHHHHHQARSAGPTPRFGPLAMAGGAGMASEGNIPMLGLPPGVLGGSGEGGGPSPGGGIAASFNPPRAGGGPGALMAAASSQMFMRRGSAVGLVMTSLSGGGGGGGGGSGNGNGGV